MSLQERIVNLETRLAEESRVVDRVWRALGVSSYEEAGGKAIDELVAELTAALAEKEAALAVAHEAIESAKSLIGPAVDKGASDLQPAYWVLFKALGAPALQSAARKDGLRRAVVEAAQAVLDCEPERTTEDARLEVALAALRAEEFSPAGSAGDAG